jgi:hypothetical protein
MRNVATTLRRRPRTDPMADYDRAPPELRAWLAAAALPWAPASAMRAYGRALRAARGDRAAALATLSARAARLVARDAGRVWGRGHPAAEPS